MHIKGRRAIKTYKEPYDGYFFREVNLLSSVKSRYIPSLISHNGRDELVIPAAEGDIRNMEKDCNLDLMCRHMLYALQDLHAAGFIHCDIKPDNILHFTTRTGNEMYKLCDFSHSRTLSVGDFSNYNPEECDEVGTWSYCAPEVACDDTEELTTAVDVYSLGATLVEMSTHNRTWDYHTSRCLSFTDFDEARKYDDLGTWKPTLLQGMLCDDPEERWTVDDCLEYIGHKRTPKKPTRYSDQEIIDRYGVKIAARLVSNLSFNCTFEGIKDWNFFGVKYS